MNDLNSTILLFFRDFERDTWIRGDRHFKRLVKPAYSRLIHKPRDTGFSVWYKLLVKALNGSGYTVLTNDYRYARSHPQHPVGIVGYPFMLRGWDLPNPAILGPALFDHPQMAPNLMHDPRFQYYVVTCQWMFDIFSEVYPRDRCKLWNAGIDTGPEWPDSSQHRKSVDVLIYDKIRWERDRLVPSLLGRVKDCLQGMGLTHETVKYGHYSYSDYKNALGRSRMMVFLCEHETQGMAYQEAMASNVPIVAWDPGWWADPARARLGLGPVRTTSVPYFDQRCGVTFSSASDFDAAFTRAWGDRETFRPREYVEERLSFEASAGAYAAAYFDAARLAND